MKFYKPSYFAEFKYLNLIMTMNYHKFIYIPYF